MSRFKSIPSIIFFIILACLHGKVSFGQTATSSSGDSLVLEQLIQSVIQSHPTIKAAEEALNAADAKIALAKSGIMPNVDITASYSRVGPVPSIPFPINGVVQNFQLFPSDNFNASINFNETIYDFGKTNKSVAYETENKKLTEQGIDQAKQRLSLLVTNTFFALFYLQEGINIKKEQLTTLNEHLEFVQKKKATGSATQFELLTIQVKISGIESQLIDLEAGARVQLSVLNTLLGLPENTNHPLKKTFTVAMPLINNDSMVSYAEQTRYEMKMARQKEVITKFRYAMIKSEELPSINIFANGGGKNGYVPELNVFKANFVAGLGIRVPIFDGTRTHNNLLQASSSIKSASFETEIIQRNITTEVVESQSNLSSSQKKLEQASLQVSEAEKASSLAKVSYQSGAITNLDLLDATTNLSESRLLLLKARIDHAISIYRLKLVLGDRIY